MTRCNGGQEDHHSPGYDEIGRTISEMIVAVWSDANPLLADGHSGSMIGAMGYRSRLIRSGDVRDESGNFPMNGEVKWKLFTSSI